MSIRPIDQKSMFIKTQEVSSNKQAEISKGETLNYNAQLQHEKHSVDLKQKVMTTEETKYNRIRDEENRERTSSGDEKSNKKERSHKKEEKQFRDPLNPKGKRVDIRI